MGFEHSFDTRQYDASSLMAGVHRTADSGTVRVVVRGDIDAVTADRLCSIVDDVLTCQRPQQVEIDLAGVGFLDSAGIRALLRCRSDADRVETVLRLSNAPHDIVRVLEITGLAAYFGLTGPAHRAAPDA
jgi:anti-sigma B factor antagonist